MTLYDVLALAQATRTWAAARLLERVSSGQRLYITFQPNSLECVRLWLVHGIITKSLPKSTADSSGFHGEFATFIEALRIDDKAPLAVF